MIASCGVLGLDWERVTRGEFLDAVAAHNRAQQPDKPEPASAEFRGFMKGLFRPRSGVP